jgi:hypothetical protein
MTVPFLPGFLTHGIVVPGEGYCAVIKELLPGRYTAVGDVATEDAYFFHNPQFGGKAT